MELNLQLLCVLVVFAITIQQASSAGCYHGQHDPPDPAKSHKLPCKRPDALIHCPCPNCDQEFENAEQMQQHIDHYHPDCYYCRREGIGGRGPDSPVSCRCEEDDDHYFSDGDFTTAEPPYSSGEDEPEDGMCTLGMCEHYKHQRPMWSHYDSRRFRQLLDYYIRKVDSNAPRQKESDDSSIEDDEDAASRIRVAEACFEFDSYENQRLQTGSVPSQAASNYQEGASSCANSLPSTSDGITGCCGRGRPLWFRGKWTPKPKQTSDKKGQKRLETCFTEANPTPKNRNKLICIDVTDEAAASGPQLDRPSTSKDTQISIPCIDITEDSDDSIEFIPLDDNSIQIIETNPNQPAEPQTGSSPTANNEIYRISSDEEQDTWKASNGKTYCLPKRKGKKTSTTKTPERDDFSKHSHYSSSTQGPEGQGSGLMSSGAAIGGMICHLAVTSSKFHRYPRSANDDRQQDSSLFHSKLTVSGKDYWNLFSEQTEHLIASSTLGQRMPSSVSWHCEPLTPKPVKTWRDDFRCRGNFLTESAEVAGCNPDNDSAHCCSEFNYCGNSRHHCHGPGSLDYRNYTSRIRSEDNRCGFGHLSPSGLTAICDPHSDKPCCSQYGRCGGEEKHCRGGTDFRRVSEFTETRRIDGLCGRPRGRQPYLAKDGKTAICTSSECCSLFNFCGEGPEYCWRGTNFTAMSTRELEKFRSQ